MLMRGWRRFPPRDTAWSAWRLCVILRYSAPPLRLQRSEKTAPWGGRPLFDHVPMFKVLIVQAMHSLSDELAEFRIKDGQSFMRFRGFRLADPVSGVNLT